MTPLLRLAIDRVDRIEPRVQEQPERRRRGTRPFPEVDKDAERRERKDAPAGPRAADDDAAEDDGEPHLIDVRVLGRLPTGQILPGDAGAALPN
jgi:hypothetical protein